MVQINIVLKCIGTSYNNYYQSKVKIYDNCNNLIHNEFSYNGEIKV